MLSLKHGGVLDKIQVEYWNGGWPSPCPLAILKISHFENKLLPAKDVRATI